MAYKICDCSITFKNQIAYLCWGEKMKQKFRLLRTYMTTVHLYKNPEHRIANFKG